MDQIKQLQILLNQRGFNIPITGVLDTATTSAMNSAVAKSLSTNPQFTQISGGKTPEAVVSAYSSGDFGGLNTLTGQPFSPEDQATATSQAAAALAPGFNETKAYDTSNAEDSIQNATQGFNNYLNNEATDFKKDKNTADQDAATSGILYSGSRIQNQNNLRKLYSDREDQQRQSIASNINTTAKNYQYQYGNDAAPTLSSYYNALSGGNDYNAGVAGGAVTPRATISGLYNPSQYNFQGTAVNAQNANVQTRAAGLLANKANKLTSLGYNNKY